ncbi:MAG: 2-(1,2-epoxy-1,2-dihydrophenyl)acetyl-CoA isomerase [Alphaproteobacteria bacterium]|nr:2-(1,2-epoxy-1,2-dihydrophenyl)acetyl-CoA isomerase [Alphaproteobacteria bacterium]
MSKAGNVLVEREGDVAVVTLNAPSVLNAFTPDMALEIAYAMNGAVAAGARALLVTGAGRGFCAGANLGGAGVGEGKADVLGMMETYYKPLARAFANTPVPVVTAVNGVAAGAGASLALAGDIIIAARSANFVFTFANIGLTPDIGGTWLVAHAAGRVRALEMALLGGKMSAEKAERCNLVTEVVDDEALMDRARKVAAKLAAMPTKTLALIKQQVRAALEQSFEATLQIEGESQQAAVQTEDFREGVRAFAERRAPQFRGQ